MNKSHIVPMYCKRNSFAQSCVDCTSESEGSTTLMTLLFKIVFIFEHNFVNNELFIIIWEYSRLYNEGTKQAVLSETFT